MSRSEFEFRPEESISQYLSRNLPKLLQDNSEIAENLKGLTIIINKLTENQEKYDENMKRFEDLLREIDKKITNLPSSSSPKKKTIKWTKPDPPFPIPTKIPPLPDKKPQWNLLEDKKN